MEGSTLRDLDNKGVQQDLYDKANAMTSLFHDFCMMWAKDEARRYPHWEEDFTFPYQGLGAEGSEYNHKLGHYWGFRLSVDDHEYNMGYSVLYLYVAVSDELGGFDLVGFYEEGELVYLVSRVDTSWSDVWSGQFPTGFIDMSQPYARKGQFTNVPKDD
jgi:hypothetical protein